MKGWRMRRQAAVAEGRAAARAVTDMAVDPESVMVSAIGELESEYVCLVGCCRRTATGTVGCVWCCRLGNWCRTVPFQCSRNVTEVDTVKIRSVSNAIATAAFYSSVRQLTL